MVRTQPPALQGLLNLGIPEKERKHPDEDSNPSCLGSWLTEDFQHIVIGSAPGSSSDTPEEQLMTVDKLSPI